MWEIYTLGGGVYLVDIFNGVAALVSSDKYTRVMEISALIALFIIMMKVAFSSNFKPAVTWMATFMVIYNVVMLPKVTVNIVDSINPSLAPSQVANVPFGLAILSSLVSEIGHKLTAAAEQVYSLPDDIKYQKSGMIFGSQLMAKTTQIKIVDSNFAENMNAFAKQCIFYDLSLGRYTINDMKVAPDIWQFLTVQNTPSSLRGIYYKDATGSNYKTCLEASVILSNQWTSQIDQAATVFAPSVYSGRNANAAKALLLSELPVSHEFLVGASRNASSILQQNMMINAIHYSLADFAASTGSTTAMDIYANARSDSQTEASYRIIARKAGIQISRMKVIFEAIYYGAFPFIFLLMLMPEGFSFFRTYAMGLAWLQLWGPMNAILHRLMMGEARDYTFGISSMPNGNNALTLVSQSGIEAVNNDIAVTAGFFASTIPFLSLMLTKSGVSAFGSLATSYLGISHGAASQAAQETTTGNMSIGNSNFDNHSFGSTSGNKFDTSGYMDSHTIRSMGSGGMRTISYADGHNIVDRAGMVSNLGDYKINSSQTASARLSQEAARYENMSQAESISANEHYSTAYEKTGQLMHSINQQQSSGIDYSQRLTSDQSNAVESLSNHTKKFAQNEQVSESIGSKMLASVSAETPSFLKFKASLTGSGYAEHASRENYDSALEYSKQHNIRESLSIGTSIAENKNLNIYDSQGNSLNDSINNNLRQALSLDESSSINHNKSESYNEAASQIRENSVNLNQDLSQNLTQWLQKQNYPGVSNSEPIGEIGARELLSSNDINKQQVLSSFMKQFAQERSDIIYENAINKIESNDFTQQYNTQAKPLTQQQKSDIDSNYSTNIYSGSLDMNESQKADNNNLKYDVPMQIEENRYSIRTSNNNGGDTQSVVEDKLDKSNKPE